LNISFYSSVQAQKKAQTIINSGLLRVPVNRLLPTRSELGGAPDSGEKGVFQVLAKALHQQPTIDSLG